VSWRFLTAKSDRKRWILKGISGKEEGFRIAVRNESNAEEFCDD